MKFWIRCLKGLKSAACGYHERGGYDSQLRFLACEGAQYVLQSDDAPEIDENERHGERTVDQGAVDDDVYVIEPVAQDGDADGHIQDGDGYGVQHIHQRFREQRVEE